LGLGEEAGPGPLGLKEETELGTSGSEGGGMGAGPLGPEWRGLRPEL
jgi:hypothetical protein